MNYFLKRLGAWYYKEYRNVYELHKSCVLKFGCTLIFVLIQILCDKNYSCKKRNDTRKSDNITSTHTTLNQKKNFEKSQMKNSIELNCSSDVLENEIFFNQPGEKNMSHSLSCYPKSHDRVTFNKETLKFPPSFNLQSRQKSTPKPLANLSLIQKNQFQTPNFTLSDSNQNATSTFQTANTFPQTAFQTANTPPQTVVSIETNANSNQSVNDIETIV